MVTIEDIAIKVVNEFVTSFDSDECEDITHVYVSLKFTTGGYKPKHVG
jgi:Mg2+/Co2+ transporter CorC